MKIISIVGARPNFIKLAPVQKAIAKHPEVEHMIVHTGQHYDYEMSKSFFEKLSIPEPTINLGIGSGSHGEQIGKILIELEKIFLKEKPDVVVVYGDVNSTVAASLAAAKLGIKIAHVEAGLRSYDRSMPEEINRVVSDHLSDYLFATDPESAKNLKKEGINQKKIFLVGDTTIDNLVQNLKIIEKSDALSKFNLQKGKYIVSTIHRPSNVDSKEKLEEILKAFSKIQGKTPIILPLHPRTRKNLESFGLMENAKSMKNLIITEPLNYIDFIKLVSNAAAVVSDSGGVRQEAAYFGIPSITIRENTERPDLVKMKRNVLCKTDRKSIVNAVKRHAISGKPLNPPKGWDGKASERIAKILLK